MVTGDDSSIPLRVQLTALSSADLRHILQQMNFGAFIAGIAHVGVRVHDLARARAFYERLGFEFVAGPIGPEPVAILSHPSGIEINLILNAASSDVPNILMDVSVKHPGYTHIAMAVRDVAAAERALAAQGIALSGGPITFPTGSTSIFIRDPDRNVIEFNQAAQ
jgi:lactoylglutathione lyase